METKMPFDVNNLMFHIKRVVYPNIRLGYQTACDYPVVLGTGVLLLFLHKLCPSLFTFLLSSSPVFLLTALLLGALLSYGEPSGPVIGEETLESQKKSSPESKVSVTERSAEEVQNVAVTCSAKCFETPVVCTEERTSDILVHDSHRDEENVISMSAGTLLCAESSKLNNEVIVEREEHVKGICEEVDLQQFESTTTERCHYGVNNHYQFGEFMSACWDPVMRQEPCSDSESDLSDSSSDASITDIIPMLDELNLPVNLEADHPSATFRDNLNSSSDDDEDDSEEDGDLSSDKDRTGDDGNNRMDFMDPESSDTEKNGNLESMMERRKAKNILKFELDRRLMDMQDADAIQKMEEASRFRVQVPSISTPRHNPFDPSNGSEEIVELPQIPDSAPSVLLPWRKPFDIPFDQIVDRDSRLQETWTPCSRFPLAQCRKHENLYLKQSTYLQHHNATKTEKPEVSEKSASDNHSDNDSEQASNNGKLFGSLEPHVGDEIKILSAAISDVCVLEVNHGIDEATKITDSINGTDSFYIQKSVSSTSEANDSVSAGCEQLLLCSLSEEYNTEKHIVEADSICEVNSLFKCRMEEVLVQSISESGIDQPLTCKLEQELNGTLSAESALTVIEARSVEELNSQFVQLNGEALECAASDSSCDDEPTQDRSSEALHVENGHTSELPTKDCHSYPTLDNPVAVNVECKSKELLTEDTELPVLEASSVEEMNSPFRQLDDEASAQMTHSPDLMVGEHNGDVDSGVVVPDANSSEGISSAFMHLSNDDEKIKIPGDGEVILGSAELNSGLHVMEINAPYGDDTSGFDSTKAIAIKESLERA